MRAHRTKKPILLLVNEVSSEHSGTPKKDERSWLDARGRRLRALLSLQARRERGMITKRPRLMRV